MKNAENYEIKNLRFGEFCVVVEFCSDCSQHSSSLRHDEQKYLNKALEIKSFIQNEFPFIKIYLKPLQAQLKENVKKLGLFEVYFAGYNYQNFKLIASKLTTLKWPNPKTVINNIRQYFDGKCIDFQLQVDDLFFFHPENQFLNNIKTVLTTSLDYEKVIQNYQPKSQKRKISSKQNFKKQRKLSSIVQSKIKSGYLNEDTVKNLIDNKKYYVEKTPDQNMNVQFVNVKPGKYKFLILENKNLQFSCYDIFVEPYIRKDDDRQSFQACLQIVDKGLLQLQIEFEEDNPIIQIQIKPKDDHIGQSFNSSEVSSNFIDIFLTDTLQKNDKFISCFEAKDLQPGIYESYIEYRNYEIFQQEIFVFQGQNIYNIEYPNLLINYDFKQDEQLVNTLIKQQNYCKMMPVIIENPKIENRSAYSQKKKSFILQSDSNAKSHLEFTNGKHNDTKRSQNSFKAQNESYRSFENKENLTNSQSQIIPKSNQEIKETQHVKQKSYQDVIKKEKQNSNFNDESFESKSQTSKSSDSKSSKSSKKSNSSSSKSSKKTQKSLQVLQQQAFDNNKYSENLEKKQDNCNFQNQQKQRIASGNKIRPGERLYSAKSNNFNHTQPGESPHKQMNFACGKASAYNDGVWENLNYDENKFQIFMQENSQVELGMDFIVEIEDVNQQNFMEEDQEQSFQKISLNYINEFRLGRIFLKKVEKNVTEDIKIYIQCGGRVEKIKLTEFLKQYSNENEKFCDLCILTKDDISKKFKANIFLVPMQEPLLSTTGLFEIKKLVDFVTNSKFAVSRFFGFELDFEIEQNEKKDYTIQEKEALECLKNYEIYCNTNYILNSIKYDKKGNLSLRRLEKIYPKWKFMIQDLGELLCEIQTGQEQSEEEDEFDADEFEEFQINQIFLIMYKNILIFVFCLFSFSHCMRRSQNYNLSFYPTRDNKTKHRKFHQRYNNEDQFESFVDDEYQDYFDIQENQQKQKKAVCEAQREHIDGERHEVIDSEIVECNWYASGIIVQCHKGFLKSIHVLLQNVNSNMTITEPEIEQQDAETNQVYYFPTYTYLSQVDMYQVHHNRTGKVAGFRFLFKNGERQYLKCKEANTRNSRLKKIQNFDINQSIAGVIQAKEEEYIFDVKFHTNTLQATQQNWNIRNQSYLQIAQNYELIHKAEQDQLENKKIYGIQKGQLFTDKDFNDSWEMTKIVIKSNGYYINKVQTFLKQKYFNVQVQNEHHNCKSTLKDTNYKEKTINFPNNAELVQIDFYLHQHHICGLSFHFSDDTSQKIDCLKIDATKKVKLSSRQVFLGFYGYKDDKNINSLGILERYESKDFVTKWGTE